MPPIIRNNVRLAFDLVHAEVAALDAELTRIDSSDEHDRFAVYSVALGYEHLVDLLLDAVTVEEDKALQHSMFVLILEAVPYSVHSRVLAVAPESEYLATRSTEVGLCNKLIEKSAITERDRASLLAGTDWLQRRLAESSSSGGVLKVLGESGNTKRIRRQAMERIDVLKRQQELETVNSSIDKSSLGKIAASGSTHKVRNAARRKLASVEKANPSTQDGVC